MALITATSRSKVFNVVHQGPVHLLGFVVCATLIGGCAANASDPMGDGSEQSTPEGSTLPVIAGKSSTSQTRGFYGGGMAFDGSTLHSQNNDFLISPDYTKILTTQSDGNVVLYCAAGVGACTCNNPQDRGFSLCFQDGTCDAYRLCPYAATGTNWNDGEVRYLSAQSDGNLVLYKTFLPSNGGSVIRTKLGPTGVLPTGTNGKGSYNLALQDDGNLVIYDRSGNHFWATGTPNFSTWNGVRQCPDETIVNGLPQCYVNTPLGAITWRYGVYFGGVGSWGAFFQNGAFRACYVAPSGSTNVSTCRFTTPSQHVWGICESGNDTPGCRIFFDSHTKNPGGTAWCDHNGCTVYDSKGSQWRSPPPMPTVGAMFPAARYPGLSLEQMQELRDQANELAHAIMEFYDLIEMEFELPLP